MTTDEARIRLVERLQALEGWRRWLTQEDIEWVQALVISIQMDDGRFVEAVRKNKKGES